LNYKELQKIGKNMNVLFVDDDDTFRKEFSELLQMIFKEVIVKKNGEEGILVYKQNNLEDNIYFDLVITDIKMPAINGVKFVDLIYKINSDQCVIIISAKNDPEYLIPFLNLGVDKFLPKPIQYTTFTKELLNVCKKISKNKCSKNKMIIQIDAETIWNKEKKELLFNNKFVYLTKKEILFIENVIDNNGRIYTTEELISYIWFNEYDSTHICIKNLKNLISRVRKKISNLKIKNIYGLGYKIYY
jgi:DNA-binding response OmpR family regulator